MAPGPESPAVPMRMTASVPSPTAIGGVLVGRWSMRRSGWRRPEPVTTGVADWGPGTGGWRTWYLGLAQHSAFLQSRIVADLTPAEPTQGSDRSSDDPAHLRCLPMRGTSRDPAPEDVPSAARRNKSSSSGSCTRSPGLRRSESLPDRTWGAVWSVATASSPTPAPCPHPTVLGPVEQRSWAPPCRPIQVIPMPPGPRLHHHRSEALELRIEGHQCDHCARTDQVKMSGSQTEPPRHPAPVVSQTDRRRRRGACCSCKVHSTVDQDRGSQPLCGRARSSLRAPDVRDR